MRNYQTKSNVGGIADSITPEKLGAGEANSFLTELKTAVSSSGQTPAPADGTGEATNQLSRALAAYGAGGGQSCRDTGTANNFVLDSFGSFNAIPTYFEGMMLTFTPNVDNTGGCNLNYNGLGDRAVKKPSGVDLKSGEVLANRPITVRYGAAGYFELISENHYTKGVTYTIGPGGDYDTINQALEDVTRHAPTFKNSGVTVVLELQPGFVMAEQVLVSGRDYGWIRITGADPETTIDQTALTISFGGALPAFGVVDGGVLPIIGQLFTMSSGAGSTKNGVQIQQAGSQCYVLSGCGVKNAGGNGCIVTAGRFFGTGAIFSNAGRNGVQAADGAVVGAESLSVQDAGERGVYIHRGSRANIQNTTMVRATVDGLRVEDGSTVNAEGVNVFDAGTYGIYCGNASAVHAGGVDANDAGTLCLYAENCGVINAGGSKLTGLGAFDVDIDDLSFIDISNPTSGGTFSGTFNSYTTKGCVAK